MKFIITKASNLEKYEEVEINTLDELLKLVKRYDESIIIEKDCENLTIYDDYLE